MVRGKSADVHRLSESIALAEPSAMQRSAEATQNGLGGKKIASTGKQGLERKGSKRRSFNKGY